MSAETQLQNANLTAALEALQEQVRDDPSKVELRTFLFQLLAVMGEWDRALTQLQVTGELDAIALAMVQTYREAIQCEVFRKAVFAGERSPLIFGEPTQWIALLLEALRAETNQKFSEATELRGEAFELAPTTSGTLNDEPFEWIADADGRLGPIVEVIMNGQYYWVPFDRIAEIRIEEPADLRDKVWTPAWFTWANGGETVGLIPTRYPNSELSDDDEIRLARKTTWIETHPDMFKGRGQRIFTTSSNEIALMDVRHIQLDTTSKESADG